MDFVYSLVLSENIFNDAWYYYPFNTVITSNPARLQISLKFGLNFRIKKDINGHSFQPKYFDAETVV